MTTENFKTLHIVDTVFNADSVEWCPIPPHQNSFACGTYNLVEGGETECRRIGSIIIFTLTKDNLEKNHVTKCSAILDLKWCRRKINDKIILAAANALGEVSVFYFENKILNFISKYVLKKVDGDLLALSIDWAKENGEDLICTSDSKGNITILKFSEDVLSPLKGWNAHGFEAWITCFNSFNNNIIYSGGDEGTLKVWDWRCEAPSHIFTSKMHGSGVTSLNSNAYKEYNLVSGGYDENVFFWDVRNWKQPVGTITASGGLWRLKWEPKNSFFLLGACMHGGFQIYNSSSYSIVGEYKEHESLAYGADWCSLSSAEVGKILSCENGILLATCSFYDHKLCVSVWVNN